MVFLKEKRDVEYKDTPCAKEGCKGRAISLSKFCWDHISDKERYKEDILVAIKEKNVGRFNLHKSVLKDIELSKANFSGADLTQADLSSANLFDTDLSGADLVGANLSGSDLTGADLSGADLTRANLTGARLWNADLSNAKLVEVNLTDADLWQSRLCNTRLWRADISRTKSLTKQNFLCGKNRFITKYRIYETGHIAAEDTYRNLKRYFINEGRYGDASWASFKEKTMEKIRLKKDKSLSYIPVAFMGFLCGYGERPQRIVFSSGLIIFIYAVIFYLLKSIKTAAPGIFTLSFGDYIYYSVVTFTTLGYGDIIPKVSTAYRLLAVSEAFLGAFMMGLFIFTLARKYSAR